MHTPWLRSLVVWISLVLGLAYGGPASAASPGTPTLIPGTWELYSIACPTSTCYAAGQNLSGQDVVVALTNGLAGAVSVGSGSSDVLSSMACPSASTCFAVGQETPGLGQPPMGALVSIGSGSPGGISNPSGWLAITGVACPSASNCYGVGNSSIAGAGMVVPVSSDGLGAALSISATLSGIACPTVDTCFGVGNQVAGQTPPQPSGAFVAIVDGSPGLVSAVSGTGTLAAITCPSSAACYAMGLDPTASHWVIVELSNSTAGPASPIAGSLTLSALGCATASTCYAVGQQNSSQQGVVVPITNGVPASPIPVAGTGFLNAIACPSVGTCYAVGNNQSSFLQQGLVVAITN